MAQFGAIRKRCCPPGRPRSARGAYLAVSQEVSQIEPKIDRKKRRLSPNSMDWTGYSGEPPDATRRLDANSPGVGRAIGSRPRCPPDRLAAEATAFPRYPQSIDASARSERNRYKDRSSVYHIGCRQGIEVKRLDRGRT